MMVMVTLTNILFCSRKSWGRRSDSLSPAEGSPESWRKDIGLR
jgi:hypothetical protein